MSCLVVIVVFFSFDFLHESDEISLLINLQQKNCDKRGIVTTTNTIKKLTQIPETLFYVF